MRAISSPKMCRFQFLDFSNQVTIRTFSKDVYILKAGLIVQEVETRELKRIDEIYYDIRTVRTIKGTVLAKRKNKNSELFMLDAS